MDRLNRAPTLSELAQIAGVRLVRGNGDMRVERLASLASAGPADLSFLSHSRYAAQARTSSAGAIVAREIDMPGLPPSCAVLATDDPYRAVAAIGREFEARLTRLRPTGVHASAVVASDVYAGPDVYIGPQAVVEAGVRLGRGASIGAGCYVGEGVQVGADTVLRPRVTIYRGCKVGERCLLHSGVIIGADGFGFAPAGDQWEKIPQLGAVNIGDDVEIGANTTIDRGTFDDTEIGNGCKLDNQIQVGHNVRIGEGTAIAGCVGIAGSATVGKRCRIGGSAGILGHLEICDDVTISAMSLVTRSLRKPGFYSGIFPLMENAEWERAAATLRRLPTLRERIRALEAISRGAEQRAHPAHPQEVPHDGKAR